MGWSCTSAAYETLTQWEKFSQSQGWPSNTYYYDDRRYFWEIGRENPSGAITGSVFQTVEDPSLKPGQAFAKRVGSFKIEPDGKVSRWPSFFAGPFIEWFKCEFCDGVECKPADGDGGCICTCHVMLGR